MNTRDVTEDDFLTLTLPERIKWLHGKDGPRGFLSHDSFAKVLGTSRQVIIDWEKGAQPGKRYRDKLAKFSGFRPEVFARREAEALEKEMVGRRLRSLEGEVRYMYDQLTVAFGALGLELAPREEQPHPQAAGDVP